MRTSAPLTSLTNEPLLPAGEDLLLVGFLVNAALAARFELEMFDRIGDVRLCALDAGSTQCAIEQFARRPYERFASQVFTVTGLFTDQDYARGYAARAEYGLRGVLPQRTGTAMLGFFAQGCDRWPRASHSAATIA